MPYKKRRIIIFNQYETLEVLHQEWLKLESDNYNGWGSQFISEKRNQLYFQNIRDQFNQENWDDVINFIREVAPCCNDDEKKHILKMHKKWISYVKKAGFARTGTIRWFDEIAHASTGKYRTPFCKASWGLLLAALEIYHLKVYANPLLAQEMMFDSLFTVHNAKGEQVNQELTIQDFMHAARGQDYMDAVKSYIRKSKSTDLDTLLKKPTDDHPGLN